jgi:hypothetical protein
MSSRNFGIFFTPSPIVTLFITELVRKSLTPSPKTVTSFMEDPKIQILGQQGSRAKVGIYLIFNLSSNFI